MSSNLTGEKTLNDNQHLENRTVKGFIFCRPQLYCSRCVHNAACFKYFLAVKYFLGVREVVPAAAVRLAAALINTILKLLYRTNLPPSPSPAIAGSCTGFLLLPVKLKYFLIENIFSWPQNPGIMTLQMSSCRGL